MRRHASNDVTQSVAPETRQRATDALDDAYVNEFASARGTIIGLIVGSCLWVAIILAAAALLAVL